MGTDHWSIYLAPLLTGTITMHDHPIIDPATRATDEATGKMQRAIQSGVSDEPLVSDDPRIAEHAKYAIQRVRQSLFTGKPPLCELEETMDTEQTGGRLSRITYSLDVIDSKAQDIGSHAGNPTGKARIIRERVAHICKELGIEP